MLVSVIVPTYKRQEEVVRCLASLRAQEVTECEVVLVDNEGNDGLRAKVEEFQVRAGMEIMYVRESRLGSHHARNAGARAARGSLLAFTEDDATVDARWLRAYLDAFDEHPEMVAAGGPIRPVWGAPPPRWLLEYMGDSKIFRIFGLMEPFEEFRLAPNLFFFSGNMAIRRDVLLDVGGFNPEKIGSMTVGDGESGLLYKLQERGKPIGYVPNAVVYHHIPPSRMTVGYVRTWAWHLGGAQMYSRWRGHRRHVRSLIKEGVRIIWNYWHHWLTDLFVRHRQDPRAIEVQFRSSVGWCKLNYLWWMVTDTRVQNALDGLDAEP